VPLSTRARAADDNRHAQADVGTHFLR
jgi:hypothetical protein